MVLLMSSPLRADDTAPGELLKPSDGKHNSVAHKVTYKLSDGSDKWDASAKDRIVKAMDAAVAVYNKYGEFDRVLTANWNPGTPTADANFGGWINFGGQIGTRTALHEIAHTLGVGTCPKWHEFAKDGKWTGKYAIAQLKELDGPDAVLHCDRQHFWPYGLNYDNEGSPDAFRRNVLMVTALRADMGLGPPPHPAAVALRVAKEDADSAHAAVDNAQSDFNAISTKLHAGLNSRAAVIQATKAAHDARAAMENANAAAMDRLKQNPDYQKLQAAVEQTSRQMDAAKAGQNADGTDATVAANAVLRAKSDLAKFQAQAFAADVPLTDAKSKYASASANLEAVKLSMIDNDPDYKSAKTALLNARAHATNADQAVQIAEKAAIKEQAGESAAK
jgi:hypothetical protein